MIAPSTWPRLVDMIEAIDHLRDVIADVQLESSKQLANAMIGRARR
jgi:hypothetical protein